MTVARHNFDIAFTVKRLQSREGLGNFHVYQSSFQGSSKVGLFDSARIWRRCLSDAGLAKQNKDRRDAGAMQNQIRICENSIGASGPRMNRAIVL